MKKKYIELKEPKDWLEIEGKGDVYFCDGYGYAINKFLQTVCIGKEKDIKEKV